MLDVRAMETDLGLARWEPDGVVVLDCPYPTVAALLSEHGSLHALASYGVRRRLPVEEAVLVRPGVGAVWGVGLNYRSKAALTGRDAPSEPLLFAASPTALASGNASVVLPEKQTQEMDYEAEIGFVVGSALYRATPDEVWPAIAAATAVNDITARDVMRATQNPTLAKSFPGFKPVGASYASLDELRDRDCIRVRAWVNDEPRQDDSSAGMIFSVPELVSRLSHWVALAPGDLVITGTPAGTGQDRQQFLRPGDEVRVEVDAVLPLVTTVCAPTADAFAAPRISPPNVG